VKTLPKNIIARLSRAGSQQQDEVLETALAGTMRGADDGNARRSSKQRERGRNLLNRNTLV
jgi:hypothetical protein